MSQSKQEAVDIAAAIIGGDVAKVREWLATGPTMGTLKLRAPDGRSWSALQLAALAETRHQGSAEVTRALVEATETSKQAEALHFFASEDAYVKEATALLNAGVPVDVPGQEASTALQLATGNGNAKMVQLLLKRGADATREGPSGSALKTSSSKLLTTMMKAALEHRPFCVFACHDLAKVRANLEARARAVRAFLLAHPDESVFVVAFEAGRTKANSERTFAEALARGRSTFPGEYETEASVQSLRFNVGDFGFVVPAAPTASPVALDFGFLAQRGEDDDRTERELEVEAFTVNRAAVLEGVKVPADFRFMYGKHHF